MWWGIRMRSTPLAPYPALPAGWCKVRGSNMNPFRLPRSSFEPLPSWSAPAGSPPGPALLQKPPAVRHRRSMKPAVLSSGRPWCTAFSLALPSLP